MLSQIQVEEVVFKPHGEWAQGSPATSTESQPSWQSEQSLALAQARAELLAAAHELTGEQAPAERELTAMLHQLSLSRLLRSTEYAALFTRFARLYPEGWLNYLVAEAVAGWLVQRGEFTVFSSGTLVGSMQQHWPQAADLWTGVLVEAVECVLQLITLQGRVRTVAVGAGFPGLYTAV